MTALGEEMMRLDAAEGRAGWSTGMMSVGGTASHEIPPRSILHCQRDELLLPTTRRVLKRPAIISLS
jgi:hypothetical protein